MKELNLLFSVPYLRAKHRNDKRENYDKFT